MEELEILQVDIQNLKNGYKNIMRGIYDIKDVEGIDEVYKKIDLALQEIDELRLDKESEEESKKEELEAEEHAEEWKAERRQQDLEYENSKF